MKRTVITIETLQRTTIRSRKAARFVRCEQCAADAPSEAAAQLQTAVREAFRMREAGEIHCSETENGARLVCCNSCRSHLR